MKKKLLALFAVFAMVFSMAGCSKEGVELISKMQEVSAWDASSMQGNMKMNMSAAGVKMNMAADIEGYMLSKEMKAEMTLNIKEFTMEGDGQKLAPKFSPMKMYMDGVKMYISTSYFKDVAAVGGAESTQALGQVFDLSKDYIAIDMTSTLTQLGITKEQLYNSSADMYKSMTDCKTEVPITKDGDQYKISLDETKLVDVVSSILVEALESEKVQSGIADVVAQSGEKVSQEEIDTVIAQVKALMTEENKKIAKDALKGTKADISYTFGKDEYKCSADMNIAVNVMNEKVSMGISENITAKKADKKAITFPTSVATYDYMEMLKQAYNSVSTSCQVEVAKAETMTKNGVVYVPVKKVAEAAGLKVGYDPASKSVYVQYGTQQMPIDTVSVKGVAYIPQETAAEYGIEVIIK